MAKYKKRADGRYATSVTYLGKKHYFTAKTSAELDRKVQEFKIAKRSGTYNSNMLFGDWATHWLLMTQANIQPTTFVTYANYLNKHILPAFGKIPLCNIQQADLREFFYKLLQIISSNTASRLYIVLKAIFKQAVEDDLLSKSPMRAIKSPKPIRKKPWCALTEQQVQALINYIDQPEHQLLVKLAAVSGLRRGELLGLRIQDIDAKRKVIYVCQCVKIIKKQITISQYLKTSSSRRIVSLPEALFDLIRRQISEIKLKSFRDEKWQSNNLLFPADHGAPRDPNWLTQIISRYGKKANMPAGFSLHSLRHTSASLMLQHGINYKIVQERLGHSKASTTLNIYSHVMPGDDTKAAETLSNII